MHLSTLLLLSCFYGLTELMGISAARLEERFAWKQVEFDWPDSAAEQEAIANGQYIKEHNLPLGVERWQNKLFITVPRWKSGIAAPLTYVNLDTMEQSPKLKPYPNWEAAALPIKNPSGGETVLQNNATVISVFRLQADVCDRLWVMDTGLADLLGNTVQYTPNTIVIFDLKTDKVIRRFNIPADLLKDDSFLANIIVDVDGSNCDKAYAYIPDLGAYAVIVYSFEDNRAHRIKHNYFHFDPLNGDFNVDGINFQWTDGVFGMALGPMNTDGSRDVYFHALASTKEFKVSNLVLRNESYANSRAAYTEFKYVGDRCVNGQATSEVYDKNTGVIFYTQVQKDAIGCWNINDEYTPDTQGLVDSDSNALVFPNDMKIDSESNLWILSDKMPTYLYHNLDTNILNFRILTGKAQNLIEGTVCKK